jgi:hypothetical protein
MPRKMMATPAAGSTATVCNDCGMGLWIAPDAAKIHAIHLCPWCTEKRLNASAEAGEGPPEFHEMQRKIVRDVLSERIQATN